VVKSVTGRHPRSRTSAQARSTTVTKQHSQLGRSENLLADAGIEAAGAVRVYVLRDAPPFGGRFAAAG
jgi:hypothetical protein